MASFIAFPLWELFESPGGTALWPNSLTPRSSHHTQTQTRWLAFTESWFSPSLLLCLSNGGSQSFLSWVASQEIWKRSRERFHSETLAHLTLLMSALLYSKAVCHWLAFSVSEPDTGFCFVLFQSCGKEKKKFNTGRYIPDIAHWYRELYMGYFVVNTYNWTTVIECINSIIGINMYYMEYYIFFPPVS